MNPLVIKILALGLTLSQLFTRPIDTFKTHFDPSKDNVEVEQLLSSGCQYFSKEFGADQLNLNDLFELALGKPNESGVEAPESMAPEAPPSPGDAAKPIGLTTQSFKDKLDIPTMFKAYKRFCKQQRDDSSALPLDEVIAFYNQALTDIPSAQKIKTLRLKESSLILDQNGQRFTEVYADNNRRKWISIKDIPDSVQKAFVAAEDKRFFTHPGIDVHGIIRAFKESFKGSGRPQGGSTITQQVVKNLLLNDDLKFERKIKEMVLAVQVEKLLTKSEILELYLNLVFLGRSSWGVEMASQSYFGKSVRTLKPAEAAMLAGLVRGPTAYSPALHADKLQARREYVLNRMVEDGYLKAEVASAAIAEQPKLVEFESPHSRAAYYFLDEIMRDARRVAKLPNLTQASYTVRSTIHPQLQKVTEKALEDGLADYEAKANRAGEFKPEGNLAERIAKNNTSWQEELIKFRPPLFDVQWTLAVVTDLGGARSGPTVGLLDGKTLPLTNTAKADLNLYDVVYVRTELRKKKTVARLMVRPSVQGATVVLEAKTGRVLAMAGGFSYALSQLNRVTRSPRPCGSTLKPFIYLSALNLGFQPNTLIPDTSIVLPRLDPKGKDWSPHNYSRRSGGVVTIRHAVEQSLNLPTARIMSQLGRTPSEGLDYIRGITQELGIYDHPVRFYPFVLGAQEARLLDMAAAYATIANIGLKPTPHFIDTIEHDGELVYQRPRFSLQPVPSVDRVAFYQIRHILEGTVERGTAKERLSDLQGYVGGKTGTTNNDNDAWFVGFTNDLVVATWIGYDSRNVETSLGEGITGSGIALPVVESILRQSFQIYKDKEPLVGPPSDIASQIVTLPINPTTGQVNGGNYPEVFRANSGVATDTQRSLLSSLEVHLPFAQNPVGDEEDPNYNAERPYPTASYPQPGQYYQPGVETPQELWQRENRQVDPSFINPFRRY